MVTVVNSGDWQFMTWRNTSRNAKSEDNAEKLKPRIAHMHTVGLEIINTKHETRPHKCMPPRRFTVSGFCSGIQVMRRWCVHGLLCFLVDQTVLSRERMPLCVGNVNSYSQFFIDRQPSSDWLCQIRNFDDFPVTRSTVLKQ